MHVNPIVTSIVRSDAGLWLGWDGLAVKRNRMFLLFP